MVQGFNDAGEPLTDEELLAEIKLWRDALREVATKQIAVVQAHGRRIEYTRSSSAELRTTLRELEAIAKRRGLFGGQPNSAIAVAIV